METFLYASSFIVIFLRYRLFADSTKTKKEQIKNITRFLIYNEIGLYFMKENHVINFDDLPIYLQKSIREYQENKNDKYHWDIYYDDLYGSINSAQHGGELTKEEADWLREEYLYK